VPFFAIDTRNHHSYTQYTHRAGEYLTVGTEEGCTPTSAAGPTIGEDEIGGRTATAAAVGGGGTAGVVRAGCCLVSLKTPKPPPRLDPIVVAIAAAEVVEDAVRPTKSAVSRRKYAPRRAFH